MDSKPITPRLKTIPFIGIWLIGHVVAWLGLYQLWDVSTLPILAYPILSGIVLGGALGLMQKFLFSLNYGLQMRGWMRLTMFGWVSGWLAYTAGTIWIPQFNSLPLWSLIVPIFSIPALLQWLLLHRHVRGAWLWVMAAVVSAITFAHVFNTTWFTLDGFMLSGIAQGSITGLVLLWLFGMTRENQQIKRDVSRLILDESSTDSDDDDWYDDDNDHNSGYFIQG
jgi:hypothetical protein